jgi:methyl-accepting chemotaxis protein
VEIPTRSEQDVLAHSFRRMVDNLRAINGKVKEGAHVVATSINQILTSAAALTASVSETATSVSQTATTVEEVKQTAYVASQKANDISAGAQQTAEVSRSGEQAVAKAVTGMNRIREQMESISQSVVKLGEQSQVIGDIISAVGEVAEQSNLLAVNAAIEASKAGEQGKGFAVVAQEVKILAGQSKQATAQVRTILGEIQKSANVAVLVTEQGVKSVEVGVQQSLDAGESIRTLAKNITEAAHAVTQIAASSQQQLIGMDQVGVAMQSIKQASEQNANGMRQIQSAAQNLHQVGRTLQELVEQFKVTKNEHERRPA